MKLEALQGQEINEAKKILAFEATKLCHGEKAAKDAEVTAQKVFEQGSVGDDLPTIEVSPTDLESGIAFVDLFVSSGLANSKSEVKRLIKGGGARCNDKAVQDVDMVVTAANDLTDDGYVKLSSGKKKHVLVRVGA